MFRFPRLLAILLTVTIFLVACGGTADPTPAPAEPTSAPEVEEATPEAVESPECSDAIGCVEVAAGDPIRLASALVVTGPNESLGLDSQYGVEIAIKDRGQIMGHDVELQPEDDGCSAEGGQTAGQKVVSDPTIAGVIGTSCSGAGVPMSQIVCDAGIVMVSPSNTAPVLTDPGSRGACYFRTAHNDKIQGKAMADFVFNELGITKAAAIHDGDPYTEGLASVFRDSFIENGGEIVAFEAEAADATNVEPLLTSVAAAGPELIYYPVFIPLGSLLTKTAQEIDGLDGVILAAADGVLSPDFIDATGDAAEGMFMSGPDLGFGNSIYETFLATYQSEYGTEPTAPFHAHAYDATNMVLDAIASVAQVDADGNMLIGRQALIDAVGATSGMAGITGTLTCDANGDCADARIAVNQVQNGEFVPVAGAADTMGGGDMTDGDMAGATFIATQFVPVEEAEKFRTILAEGGYDFTGSESGPLLDQILAGSGAVDVVGMLHGDFPPLAREGALTNMIDVAEDLLDDRDLAEAFIDTGLLGTDDFLAYVPWMQATYIMAASTEALDYLPAGADVNALSWDEFAGWCQNILDETGSQGCGLPHAGLFHRFLEGYMFPSHTGGMVSNFRSAEAMEMMAWARDVLWPTIHPESINYEFMQEPLMSGDVMVAFDHTARLIEAFNSDPEGFVAFPAPAGAAGRGFMPVIVGLGIPADAPHPEAGAEMIEFLTRPDVQGAVLKDLGFFPVVGGVDTSALSDGVAIEAAAVNAQATAPDALPALLPVGLGDRGGEINQIFRNAFDRIVLEGEEIEAVLTEEGDNLQTLMNETGAPCWAPDPLGDGPCQVNEAGSMMDGAMMEAGEDIGFVSTQFAPVEEAEKFRAILANGGYDFTTSESGPLLDQVIAGTGAINVVGMLHGDFPPLAREGAVANVSDVAEDLLDSRDLAEAFIDTGLLGTDDYLHYVPWMQATYIMGANVESLDYLPDGADIDALTWVEFGEWCANMNEATGSPKCGLPHAGLFHRFLEGYLFPSFTGGMVSNFRSDDAVGMMEWARDVLWPNVHPESINYEFMQEPMQSGDVWVAFDHTARLIDAFNSEPEGFIAFPAPAGEYGSGFMPVIVGLGIPSDAPDPAAGAALIDFLTLPETQGAVLENLGFFPVTGGVDTSNLPAGVEIEAGAVSKQANSATALPALLPVGLGDRGGEINQIFRNAFDRIVLEGEEIETVLQEEGDNLQALMDETGAPCWAPDPAGDGPCVVNP